jgi:hypothetical protein
MVFDVQPIELVTYDWYLVSRAVVRPRRMEMVLEPRSICLALVVAACTFPLPRAYCADFLITLSQIEKELGKADKSDEDFLDYRDKLNLRLSSLGYLDIQADTSKAGMELSTKLFESKLFTKDEGSAILELLKAKAGSKKSGRFEITAKESVVINGMVIMRLKPISKD